MKMKKHIIIGVIGVMTLPLGSCSDFLELKPLNEIVLEKFWNEEGDVNNIVMGCYSAMQSQAVIDRMMAWGEFRSDNIIAGLNTQDDVSLANLLKENIKANNSFTSWGDFYNIINRCNIVIHFAPKVAEKDPNYTQNELRATQAEMVALRSLCYFYLIRAFRDVPYTAEAYLNDTQEMRLAAMPFNEVLDHLIADLEAVKDYAVEKYPVTNLYAQRGRITKNAVYALLCEMYLWKQDYAKAVGYADLVIDNMTAEYKKQYASTGSLVDEDALLFDGYPLYHDKFDNMGYYGRAYDNIFGTGNSMESIFELIYMDEENYLANDAVSTRYGNAEASPGHVKPADFISADVTAEGVNKVFRNKYDTRYYENMQKGGTSSVYSINKYCCASVMLNPSVTPFSVNYRTFYPKASCRANWVIYRLTDVMLLKAEALVQQVNAGEDGLIQEQDQAKLDQALAIVNTVNKRSCCASTYIPFEKSDYNSKSLMARLVLDERQRELMFEGKRWFDLVRCSMRDGNTKYLVNDVIRKGSDNASVMQSKLARLDGIFWPYNEDELKVNSLLKQNPAFGAQE